jgi:hypothetical protein
MGAACPRCRMTARGGARCLPFWSTGYKHDARIGARGREYRALFHTGSLENEAPLGLTNSEVTLEHSRHLRQPTILQEGDQAVK